MTTSVLYDAPGPRARVRNVVVTMVVVGLLAAVVAWVTARFAAKNQFAWAKWKPFTTADLWETYMLPGIAGTLTAAAVSVVLAVLFGAMLGVGRLSAVGPLRWLCGTIVEFFRALPVLILMLFAFFLYGFNDVFPPEHRALAGVITGLTLYNSAVIAEIIRAGIQSLPRGQSEAATALGFSHGQGMRLILLPQAVTAMLPALISQLVVVLKDTAIGYQITFLEMVRQGTVIGAQYSNFVPALLVTAALMIAMNLALSWVATRVEQRLRRSARAA